MTDPGSKNISPAFHVIEILIIGRKSLSALEEGTLSAKQQTQYPILLSSSLKLTSPQKWKSDSEFLQIFND